jgi:hypothetical protein
MTDEHNPESRSLVVHLSDSETSSIDRDVPLLDDIWHLRGIGEFEVVSDRIPIRLFGRDFRRSIDMPLLVSPVDSNLSISD